MEVKIDKVKNEQILAKLLPFIKGLKNDYNLKISESYAKKLIKWFIKNFYYVPNEIHHYILATTHKSFDPKDETKKTNYERLEFLGDAFLQLYTSDLIFKNFKNLSQGELTRLRADIVNTKTLAKASDKMKLINILRTGNGRMEEEVKNSLKVKADTFEAIVGAIYIDLGIEFASNFIFEHLIKENMEHKVVNSNEKLVTDENLMFTTEKDPKTQLQEYFQNIDKRNITYETREENDKIFVAKAIKDGIVYGVGSGSSKKRAETEAARDALKKLYKY
ncbi:MULTISPECIES: ribonuclease III [unclassified Mycoplasma]|uniref:ribonuclease III n=1 Tax=unclassified Mycoplasma TaxID=2683645 RepID=UPI00197C8041|nr:MULTISPECIES: ribonuclease III [unclassified Mycoplasma]MBN4084176.1 ribonuclease III [Mycoplasma sp. CSL10166]MBU4692639.1 ribonuclease III [Mycoplasma sp. CSL7491-lung]